MVFSNSKQEVCVIVTGISFIFIHLFNLKVPAIDNKMFEAFESSLLRVRCMSAPYAVQITFFTSIILRIFLSDFQKSSKEPFFSVKSIFIGYISIRNSSKGLLMRS